MITSLVGDKPQIKTEWSSKKPYSTGYDVYGTKVNSIAYGKVVDLGHSGGKYCVCVQINSFECIRYGNLKSIDVTLNDEVKASSLIGNADKYVHFEYCTTYSMDSIWPVRIGSKTYYKQDPSDILNGDYMPSEDYKISTGHRGTMIELTSAQKLEFGNNRGDKVIG